LFTAPFNLVLLLYRTSAVSQNTAQVFYRHRPNLLTWRDRQELLQMLKQGNKIQAIKHYRLITQSGLKESKEAIDELEAEM
jgi:ribosomal protein L7/L12